MLKQYLHSMWSQCMGPPDATRSPGVKWISIEHQSYLLGDSSLLSSICKAHLNIFCDSAACVCEDMVQELPHASATVRWR